ncbi:MAG: phosphate/phosphite/phosphonate ABC transporter substrate-binding protein [Gammaproteobacteria bacterium]|nr:phosphate/phosphite/phosphonate ABC transporter substrate-binding protein [Gammaproteobacteria bacterium]
MLNISLHPCRWLSLFNKTLITTLASAICISPVFAKEKLTLGIHPYLEQSELIKRFTPLAQYLGKELKIPVEVRVGPDYQAHLNAIGQDQIDIAYLGPASYIKLTQQFGPKSLLARLEASGKPTFQGHIIVQKDSPITRLAELKGNIFAFGDPSSTMSTLVPRAMLEKKGISLSDLAGHANYKGHTNVAMAVLSGDADAGAVKEEVYLRLKHKGLRSLQITPAISEHLFIASMTLAEDLQIKLRDLLLGIRSTEQINTLLKPIKDSITGLVPVKDSDYDSLRKLIENEGI